MSKSALLEPSGAPWGLRPSLTAPAGRTRDVVHGWAYFTRLERLVANTPTMRRLDRIHQVHFARYLFKDATHTRFAHALGTMELSKRLADSALRRNRLYPTGVPLLGDEWAAQGIYEPAMAELRLLVGLGGLLHDLCTVFEGHQLEDIFGILPAHDAGLKRFQKLWARLVVDLEWMREAGAITAEEWASLGTFISGELRENLLPLIISAASLGHPPRYPFAGPLVGDTVCGDMGDWLPRDHYHSGDEFTSTHYWAEALAVTGSRARDYPGRIALVTSRGDEVRDEVLNSVALLLHGRSKLYSAMHLNRTVIAANVACAQAIEAYLDHIRHTIAGEQGGAALGTPENDAQATERLDDFLLDFGDDEVLGYLARLDRVGAGVDPGARGRRAAIAEIARDLYNRQLWQVGARCTDLEMSGSLRERFGDSAERQALERSCSAAAGVPERTWGIWCPPTDMGAKSLEHVLVLERGRVMPILGSARATIVGSFSSAMREAWAASVAFNRRLDDRARGRIVAALTAQTGSRWHLTGRNA
jgi:HD superfamily phosphohydrolase